MRVIATQRGYDNVTVREIGDEFEMPEGSKGPWFEKVPKKKTEEVKVDEAKAEDIT